MRLFLLLLCLCFRILCYAQQEDSTEVRYEGCLDSLRSLLQNNSSFKKAVFITENCFLNNQMHYDHFDKYISEITEIVKLWERANPLLDYPFEDSINFKMNFAVFKTLKDTITFIDRQQKKYRFLPYTYDFHDFFGQENWSNMFVTKLLSEHSGNCHSLPYLYKIIADELGATCWLALAPNHMYIKNRCKKIGWYNSELTSGTFPIDAWVIASGYLPLQAIQNGIYMDTLSNQQSLALCVIDLAKGYQHQTGNYSDGFILKCCDLSLQYFALNVQAILLKAETLKQIYQRQSKEKYMMAAETYKQMELLYVKLFELGYREMPDKMYLEWLQSVLIEKNKYALKQLY